MFSAQFAIWLDFVKLLGCRGGFELRNQICHCKTVCIKINLYLINYNCMRTQWTTKGNQDAGSFCSCDRGLHPSTPLGVTTGTTWLLTWPPPPHLMWRSQDSCKFHCWSVLTSLNSCTKPLSSIKKTLTCTVCDIKCN